MNEQPWKLTVLGVRGSLPAALPEMMDYGGSTSCISVDCGGELVCFDAGSGLSRLDLPAGRGGPRRLHILLTHFHIDHLLGLFGFRALHDPDMELHFYGEPGEGLSLENRLARLFGPPYWPVGLDSVPARLAFHETGPGERFSLAGDSGLTVRTLRGNHPGQSLLYRLERGEKSVVYALDCELDGGMAEALAGFSRNAGVLVWDASFAPPDLRPGWGHSTWEQGIALGREANAGTVLMTHYSRDYTDGFLEKQEHLAAEQDGIARFAKERMELRL